MAKIDLVIPALKDKFFDLRDNLPGDSYNWSWERQLSEVKYLAIHHTASDDTQTPEEIAKYHIENNGWGGIGYHFLIDKKGFVFYVGDISCARANVANMNEQVIGIGLIGNFTSGRVPTHEQLDSTQKLCEFFITNFLNLPNISSWEAVLGHRELPGQSTICPGDSWENWKQKLLKPTPGIDYVQTSGSDDKNIDILKSQVDNLQTSLATLEQQRISLLEKLQEREREEKTDNTLTITQALINLYKFILPRRVEEVA